MDAITMTVVNGPDGGAQWSFDGFEGERFPDTPAGWLCACVAAYLATYGATKVETEQNGPAPVVVASHSSGRVEA